MKPPYELQHDVGLIVVAAGSSRRFGTGRNKLLELLQGIPVFCHSLRNCAPLIRPELSVLVIAPEERDLFGQGMTGIGGLPTVRMVAGGRTRQESVSAGLAELPPTATIVAVQDAARPCASTALLAACIDSARHCGSGVAARRVTDTIKVAEPDARVVDTPDRSRLWAAETPQVFRREWLQEAYDSVRRRGIQVTDDAQAVESVGRPVFLVEHQEANPKITYYGDLVALRSLLA